ncbi:MAG: polysaccharide deacetylase family protein [Anaerolineales bacterium]|nr:polysaccharide deacetylase family protein [Anaerolineales bacterium]
MAQLRVRGVRVLVISVLLVGLGAVLLVACVRVPAIAPGALVRLTPETVAASEATVFIAPTLAPSTENPATSIAVTSTPDVITLADRLPTPTPTPVATATPAPTPPPMVEPTPDGIERTARIPILMYHYLSTPPADADVYRTDLSVPPELFAAHLDRLRAEGYTTISLYDLLLYLTRGAPLPDKSVVITFDDGYRDNYTNAFPLLQERGMRATFFVVTDFVDEERPDYLSWDMARAMLAAGMSIESHSRNHASLKGQDDDYLVWQALGSLETLQHELGVRPRFISYPAGDYDQRTIDIVASAHYWGGVTTEQGTEQSAGAPFELERVRVRNTTTPDDLIRYIEADW